MKIQSEYTAITTGVSKSAIEVEQNSKVEDIILDYGAGKLRNSKYLLGKGFHVSVLDTAFQMERANEIELSKYESIYELEQYEPKADYDVVLCSFVLNVIPEISEREEAIINIYHSLKANGKLFLEVRGKNGILKNKYKEAYKDGFLIGKNKIKTFQKPFTKENVEDLIADKFEIETIRALSDSILLIAKKK